MTDHPAAADTSGQVGEMGTDANDAAEYAQVDAWRIRTLVEMLTDDPAQMTPHAAGCFLGLCREAEAEWNRIAEEAGPAPSMEEMGFTKVGTCTDCGVDAFLREKWAHFGQDGIDHRPNVGVESIRPWPTCVGRSTDD